MAKIFILQAKGGVGKSYLTKMLILKAESEKKLTYFIDCDNESASTTKFFEQRIKGDKRNPLLKFKSINLFGKDKRVDRSKFDKFLDEVETLENVVVDFGASSSTQFMYYLQDEQELGVVDMLKQMGISLYLIIAGGDIIKECLSYGDELKKIKGIEEITKIVANEFYGDVQGHSIKEYTHANLVILDFPSARDTDAGIDWKNKMEEGVTYAEIEDTGGLRGRRIKNYLTDLFETI